MQVTGFVLGWRMTRDNLKFRQGVLPMMIYTMFLAVFFLYQGRQEEAGGIAYYMPLYMMAMISIGIQMNMSITDKGDLLSLYRSKPLERPGALILGCFKALFVKYYLPVYGAEHGRKLDLANQGGDSAGANGGRTAGN